jgi:hypothetical protein
MTIQVRRETLAGALALEAASRIIDLSEAVAILRNDAVGALAALCEGQFRFAFPSAVRHAHVPPPSAATLPISTHPAGSSSPRESAHSPPSHAGHTALEVTGPVSGCGLRLRATRLAAV